MPAGSLYFLGDKKVEKQKITYYRFNSTEVEEKSVDKIEDLYHLKDPSDIVWINITGLHKVKTFEKLGAHYDIHPLLLEDVLNTEQRLKMDVSDELILFIFKMNNTSQYPGDISLEQISIILKKNLVITFQEKEGDQFDPIRRRIYTEGSRVRSLSADFLFYALIDVVVDGYFEAIENMIDYVEGLEYGVFDEVEDQDILQIQQIKKDILKLRPCIYPLKDMISRILMSPSNQLINKETLKYFSDVGDHVNQLSDMLDRIREDYLGLKDLYISAMSLKMNKVMQVLTIIATIFIPLTFIVGVYGMNFRVMPELDWGYGYFTVWGIMISVGVALLFFFRRKGWM